MGVLALALAGGAGCGTEETPPAGLPGSEAAAEKIVEITLRRAGDETWRATYSTQVAVDSLNFGAPVGGFRLSSFLLPDGFEMIELEEEEHVRRQDGRTFDSVSLEIHSFNELVPKRYVAFNDFSDGGVSVFTGYLLPGPTRNGTTASPDGRFDFIPREGEFIVHAGRRSATVEGFRTDQLTAPFVYFGNAHLIENNALIAVVDPALPDAVHSRLTSLLPDIFGRLEESMGRSLPRRPMILASAHQPPGFSGVSTKGGTRKGQIQIRLQAENLSDLGEEPLQQMTRFFAHEGAHLWQEPVLADGEDAWIHEGGGRSTGPFRHRGSRCLGRRPPGCRPATGAGRLRRRPSRALAAGSCSPRPVRSLLLVRSGHRSHHGGGAAAGR